MKNTIVVNLFAGPGAGKSTGAAWLFAKMKMMGIDCELVTEFAKDKVWENNKEVFNCQFYITGKQIFKIKRCYGKVDVIITDSPIPTGAIYETDNKSLIDAIDYEFRKYNNLNYFIKRNNGYEPNGRNQTEDEAKKIDENVLSFLNERYDYSIIVANEEGYMTIINDVLDKLSHK